MLGEAVCRVLRVEALYKVVFSYFRDDRVTEEPLGICEVIVIPEPSEWRTIAGNIEWLCALCVGDYIHDCRDIRVLSIIFYTAGAVNFRHFKNISK